MQIAQMYYTMYHEGSSKRSFQTEISKAVFNWADIGDIIHSKEFQIKFRPFVATEFKQFYLLFSSVLEEHWLPLIVRAPSNIS